MQELRADRYVGKRVRLTASVKAEEVADGLDCGCGWKRAPTTVSFDNMMDRPIKGTTAWQNYEVILDVPQDATTIAFGILLNKSGSVWLNSIKFESVGLDVPATGNASGAATKGPINLNFEN